MIKGSRTLKSFRKPFWIHVLVYATRSMSSRIWERQTFISVRLFYTCRVSISLVSNVLLVSSHWNQGNYTLPFTLRIYSNRDLQITQLVAWVLQNALRRYQTYYAKNIFTVFQISVRLPSRMMTSHILMLTVRLQWSARYELGTIRPNNDINFCRVHKM